MSGVRLGRRGSMAGRGVLTNVLRLPASPVGNFVTTPDSAGNSIAGSLDVRIKLGMSNWTATNQMLASKWTTSPGRSWTWGIGSGSPYLILSVDGTAQASFTSTAAVPFSGTDVGWLRFTWQQSDGRVQFFTSTDGSSWTQLGTNGTIAIASIFNSTSPVVVGTNNAGASLLLAGDVYYFELRNGIAGTVIHSFNATAVTKIGTRNPSTVSAGGPWTLTGSAWDWAAA